MASVLTHLSYLSGPTYTFYLNQCLTNQLFQNSGVLALFVILTWGVWSPWEHGRMLEPGFQEGALNSWPFPVISQHISGFSCTKSRALTVISSQAQISMFPLETLERHSHIPYCPMTQPMDILCHIPYCPVSQQVNKPRPMSYCPVSQQVDRPRPMSYCPVSQKEDRPRPMSYCSV